jgi:hypothetical protein
MAHNMDWVEDMLIWAGNEVGLISTKIESIVLPDRYRTTDALDLTFSSEEGNKYFEDILKLNELLSEAGVVIDRLQIAMEGAMKLRQVRKEGKLPL